MLPAAETAQSAGYDAVDRAVDRAQLPADRLRPLAELAPARLAALRGLLTDIDDTLTRDGAIALAAGDAPGRALVLVGKPFGEAIAHYGPFVMNTQAQLKQAVEDYQSGRF